QIHGNQGEQDQEAENYVVEGPIASESARPVKRDAAFSTGDGRVLEEERIDHEGEGKRHQGEIQAVNPDGDEADQVAGRHGGETADEDREPDGNVPALDGVRGGESCDAHERGLTERDLSRVTGENDEG